MKEDTIDRKRRWVYWRCTLPGIHSIVATRIVEDGCEEE